MLMRAGLLFVLLLLTAMPSFAAPAGACDLAPSDTLEALKARRAVLENEVSALLDKPAKAASLSKSQEELLKIIFQINCLTGTPQFALTPQPVPVVAPSGGAADTRTGRLGYSGGSGTAPKTDAAEAPAMAGDELAAKLAPVKKRGLTQYSRSPASQEASAAAAAPNDAVEITTYYATNRKPSGQPEPVSFYGSDPDSVFHYGRAVVSIPPTHTTGNLELPTLWKLEMSATPGKHFVLKAVQPLAGDAMRKEMTDKLAGKKQKPLLLFVHGYNVTFHEAALRTAQMAYDLKFPGVAMFYSWPSAGSMFGYLHDEEVSTLSEPVFETLLADLGKLPFTDIYIVAHSMGNRIVAQAVEANAGKLPNVRELLLAAPDINAELFKTRIAPKLAALQKSQKTRTTIYASSSDVALQASKVIHGFRRLGETTGGVFTFPGIETIDASSASSMMRDYGHGYLVDSQTVLKDMASIVILRATEKARGLSAVGAPPAAYWRLP